MDISAYCLDAEVLQVWHSARRLPDPIPVDTHSEDALVFYTDGACAFPTQPAAHYAAWAVVRDHTSTPADRRALMSRPRDDTDMSGLTCFASGLAPHLQTAARAEAIAVMVALESASLDRPRHCLIYSDSQYVVDLCQRIDQWKRHRCTTLPVAISNMDIFARIFTAWTCGKSKVCKIKAHRSLVDARDPEDLWGIYANALADRLASHAMSATPTVVKAAANSVHDHIERLMLRKTLLYHNEVSKFREREIGKLTQQVTQLEMRSDRDGCPMDTLIKPIPRCDRTFLHLKSWSPLDARTVRLPALPVECANACNVGGYMAMLVWLWLQTLSWPRAPDPRDGDWGASWPELLVNFYVATHARFPVRLEQTKRGCATEYVGFDTVQAIARPALLRSLAAQADMLRVTVQQLQQLFPQLELMGKRTNDVISMRAFGFSAKVSGCAVRPAMRHQQESVDHLCQYCVQWSYPNNLSGMMCLPTNAPFICVADDFPVMSGAARRSLHARLKKRNRGAGAR